MRIVHRLAVGCAAVVSLSSTLNAFAAQQSASPAQPAATAAAPAAAPQFGPDGLPVAAGHDTMLKVCSGCHEPQVVLDKRLSYPDWDALVQSMVARGAQATDEEVTQITDYLATNLPASS